MADSHVGQASFAEALGETGRAKFMFQQMMNGVATATLVQVKAVQGETVDVNPMVAQIDGDGTTIPHGTINGLPILKLRAGANVVDVTPEVGDIGLAIFCHNDISAVKKNKAPSPPGSRRRFDWADGVYIGGLLGTEPTQFVRLNADGIAIQAKPGKPVRITSDQSVQFVGAADTDTEYRVDGVKVVGNRQPAITAPSGGGTIDAQSRTAIGAILAALQAHGLIS